jgi:hypothetical protein
MKRGDLKLTFHLFSLFRDDYPRNQAIPVRTERRSRLSRHRDRTIDRSGTDGDPDVNTMDLHTAEEPVALRNFDHLGQVVN